MDLKYQIWQQCNCDHVSNSFVMASLSAALASSYAAPHKAHSKL